MSKLEELIAELCPDGVEYKKMGEIATPTRGVRVIRSQLALKGEYPVFQNSMTPLGYYEESNCPSNTAFIISAGAAGEVGYSTVDFWAADDCFYFVCPEQLNSRFLYYALMCQREYLISRVRRASVPRLARWVIEDLKIPLPPLPVQREIVRILDKFTELTAELTARKKQYEYYRDLLLTFENNPEVKWMTLGECTLQTTNIKWSLENETTYKYIDLTSVDRNLHYIVETQEINKNNAPSRAQQIVKTGDVLFGTTRPLLKRYCLVDNEFDGQICSTGFCVLRANTEIVLQKWILYHIASSSFYSYVEKYQQGASYPAISDANVKNYLIPVPPLAEQERIVAILDRFDALCNDLTSGLPAEIEARRKQYEYYRDKLLTFPAKRAGKKGAAV